MTRREAIAVQAWVRLANSALGRLARSRARGVVDAVDVGEFASLMESASAAGVATGTGGNLFYESAAARLRVGESEAFGGGIVFRQTVNDVVASAMQRKRKKSKRST